MKIRGVVSEGDDNFAKVRVNQAWMKSFHRIHGDCSTTTREVNVTDDEQSTTITTPRLTPKRKSLFSNIERKNIKK
ncbi:unnamed protein product [Rotaria sp. Silwood2]|nr:unnamed protein product [Rotaria sp. Silwood2]